MADKQTFEPFETPRYDAVQTMLGVPLGEAEALLARLREQDPRAYAMLASVFKDIWDFLKDVLT